MTPVQIRQLTLAEFIELGRNIPSLINMEKAHMVEAMSLSIARCLAEDNREIERQIEALTKPVVKEKKTTRRGLQISDLVNAKRKMDWMAQYLGGRDVECHR